MELEKISSSEMDDRAAQAPDEASIRPCFLLELPPELRNKIFGLALYHSEGFVIDCLRKKSEARNPLALTETCKQIRQECSGPLYRQHELILYMPVAECPTRGLAGMVGYSRMLFEIGVCEKFKAIRIAMGCVNVEDLATNSGWGWHAFASLISECRSRELPFSWSFQILRRMDYDLRITKTRTAKGDGFHCAMTCSGALLSMFHANFANWLHRYFEPLEVTLDSDVKWR